jgi:opacity protein-like surface antigen
MYRKTIFVVFLIAFSISCGLGFCQEIKNRWYLGTDFAYIMPEDAEIKDTEYYLTSASLGYGISNNWAIELEAEGFRLKSKHDSKIKVYSLFTNLELRAKNFGKFTPYVVGGLGWAFFSYNDLHPTEKKDKSSSYAWKAGLGGEYFLTKNWAVNCEAVHFYANTGGKAHLDVYSQQYSLGIKYYF